MNFKLGDTVKNKKIGRGTIVRIDDTNRGSNGSISWTVRTYDIKIFNTNKIALNIRQNRLSKIAVRMLLLERV